MGAKAFVIHRSRPGTPRPPGGRRSGGDPARGPAVPASYAPRGGLTSKIHLACVSVGRPLAFTLTGGNTNDCTQFTAVMEECVCLVQSIIQVLTEGERLTVAPLGELVLAQEAVHDAEISQRVDLPKPVANLAVEGEGLGLGLGGSFVVRGQVPDDARLGQGVGFAAWVVHGVVLRHRFVQGLGRLGIGGHEASYDAELGRRCCQCPLVARVPGGLGGGPGWPCV
ncbi:hypothetical protein GCM10010344_39190 [Streptomyces bluensis]|nr:hypothetical protein GCM10010344_39190 [Streptomyces bluensis]